MEDIAEQPYYGYKGIRYITIALFALGVAGIACGVAFYLASYSTRALVLCWLFGVIFIACGILWHLTTGFVTNWNKMVAIRDSFLGELDAIWDGKGKALDIGTGRGWVAIEIAKKFPEARVTGIDIWTSFFKLLGQTKECAEENARQANVSDRCSFQYASALDLPFKDGEFQLVVSSFAFHEIHAPDKMALFKEIARLLAAGGTFLILDFFAGSFLKAYNATNVEDLIEKVQQPGFKDIRHKALRDTGVDLGWFYRRYWEVDYLSGKRL